ncbi:MAG: D-alanyl-D-alanine carboxypeptidase family protein [Janthinobacterium lividum]
MPSRRLLLTGAGSIAISSSLESGIGAFARPRHPPAAHPAAKPATDPDGDSSATDGATPAIAGTPAETPVGPLDTAARWAFIVDFQTNTVMLQKAADERMPPSSLTKMMTAYIVFGMLKEGRLHLDQMLPVSEKAWRMQGSKMFVPLGGQIAVSDLIRGMLIQSGNDACIVLSEGIAGSEEQFVALMNARAKTIGLTNSQFRNVTGWPDLDHYMSARDVATLARRLIADFPDDYHFFSEKDYKFNNINQGNRNVLVDKGLADGLKTGHTDAGGFGLCASSERDGRRIIEVVNGLPSSKARASEGARLLGWAFSNFENARVLTHGQVLQTTPVWLGLQPTVSVCAGTDLVLTVPHGWQNRVKVSLDYQSPVAAPIAKGQQVGLITVSGAGVADVQVPLVAVDAVARKGLPARAVTILKHYLGGT